jgi:Bardet-Biedl syndrome 2 protein
MLSNIYTLDLNQVVLYSLATISKCNDNVVDGTHPSLVCGTIGGKVFIHSPHVPNAEISFLNINKTLVCLGSGALDPGLGRDILVVGSPSSLIAYDIYSNSDLFNTDVKDGVYCMKIGKVDVGSISTDVALVGGNCSILGFNKAGDDVFWTVSGDNVSAIDFFLTEKNEQRILVGSEDYAIRLYNNEEMLYEINETAKVTNFCDAGMGKYCYSLDSGGVGVYYGTHRVWKAKAKHKVTSMACGDILENGTQTLILGWSNGKIELRSVKKGEEIYKKQIKQPIAKVFFEDYRLEGKKQLIAVTTSGKVVGLAKENSVQTAEPNAEEIEDLNRQKISLLNEIQKIKDSNSNSSIIPEYTKLNISFESNPISLVLTTNNNTCIKCVFLQSDGLFDNDVKVFHPAKPLPEVKIPMKNPKLKQFEIEVKALVGSSPASLQFQIFERKIKLPKYCNFRLEACNLPNGTVKFDFSNANKLKDWIKEKFLVNDSEINKILDGKYMFIGENENLHINTFENKLSISTDTIELSGEIIQDLSNHFGIQELNSIANFPSEIQRIKDLLEKIDDFNNVRTQLTANMAENSQNVKALILKAEDARIQQNMPYFKQSLSSLHQFNGELLGEYQIRANNHTELLNCLKTINQYIQRAGNLRNGQSKNKTISLFREGVKNRNINLIIQAISYGT